MLKKVSARVQARRLENRPALPPVLLSALALACFAAAGFVVGVVAGLVVTGVALLIMEWRLDQG